MRFRRYRPDCPVSREVKGNALTDVQLNTNSRPQRVRQAQPPKVSGGTFREHLLALTFLAVVPLILLRLTLHGVADPDTFWHIRAGQYLWGNWKFTSPDPWSPFSSRNWILHEWLPELALAAAASVGGLPAVAWLTVATGALLFLFVYLSCRSWAPILPATIASTAAVFGASASLTARPQLASFVLLAVFVGAFVAVVVGVWVAVLVGATVGVLVGVLVAVFAGTVVGVLVAVFVGVFVGVFVFVAVLLGTAVLVAVAVADGVEVVALPPLS